MIFDFLKENSDLLIALLALLLALQANVMSRKAKADSDRVLISEKRRDLVQEIDKQHVLILRLRFVVESQLVQFQICPPLVDLLEGERERLEKNLVALDGLEAMCISARVDAEGINMGIDSALIDVKHSGIARLTSHLEKDLDNEESLLEDKKHLVNTAPANAI